MKVEYILTEYMNNKMEFLLEDGRLSEARPLSDNCNLGNIYTAKVMNIVKAIDAAFLDAGTGDTLYYSLKDNEGKHIFIKHGNTDKLCIGDVILVQIIKEPVKTKKAEASSNISIRSEHMIVDRSGCAGVSSKIKASVTRNAIKDMANEQLKDNKDIKAGVMIRTVAEKVPVEELSEELSGLLTQLRAIVDKGQVSVEKKYIASTEEDITERIRGLSLRYKEDEFVVISDLVDEDTAKIEGMADITFRHIEDLGLIYDLDTRLKKLMNRRVYLKSGGYLVIDPTEAMTVIDVNSGKAISGKDAETEYLKLNIEAAVMIARVLRVRNLSGMIIVDFISMKKAESYKKLETVLSEELSKDEIRTVYVDTTALGLVEITRRKVSRPLSEVLGQHS